MVNEKGIALGALMQMPFMQGNQLLAGSSGLEGLVLDVNVMVDLDILQWIKPGDLLLTTAYVFKGASTDQTLDLLKDLKDKGLVGLCIKVFPYVNALDPAVLTLAEDIGLPIIDLNYEVSFNEIMTPMYRLFLNRQALILDRVESVHREAMRILLKGGGSTEIVQMLSNYLDHPIYYIDYQFDEVVRGMENENDLYTLTRDFSEATHITRAKRRQDQITVSGKTIERELIPVMVKDEVHGHLVVYGKQHKISNVDILSLESAASLLAIESLKKLSIKEVENKYKAEFFEDLISPEPLRREKALERAINYGFKSDAFYSIVTIRLPWITGDDNGILTSQRATKVVYLLEMAMQQQSRPYLIATKNNDLNILMMWHKKQDYDKHMDQLIGQQELILKDKVKQEGYLIGIGRCYERLNAVYQSLRDAQKAIDLAGISFGNVIRFDQMGIYKLLSHEVLKDEITEFYKATIQPLVAYDLKRDTDLVKTLEVYFEVNGNLKKMSEALFTHYNTILYRISRIKEITNKDLENEHDRYGLQTALKIRRILDLER